MKNIKFLLASSLFWLGGVNSFAQTGTVTGVVGDGEVTLPGATITIDKTDLGGVTDLNGSFTINHIPVGTVVLNVSYIGFEKQLISVTVEAKKTTDVGFIKMAYNEQLGTVTVEGTQRMSEARALSMQKKAIMATNVIAADGIGKLPDRNAAEAVQRIQGVSIERDQGEGRFVSVRGLPPFWSVTTINGNRIPTAEEETTSRATAFDFFPTEMIAYVRAAKAPTPDMEADGIGGNVDFITRNSPVKQTLSANLGAGYNIKAGKPTYNAAITYGNRTKSGKLGYVLNASYWNRNWGTDNFEARRKGDEGVFRMELRDYNGTRTTIGLNGALDYNLNANNKLYFKGLFGTLEDEEVHYKHRIRFDKFDDSDNTGRIELQNIHNELITQFYGLNFGGEHKSTRGKLDWMLSSYKNEFKYGSIPTAQDNSYFVVKFKQDDVAFEPTYLMDKGNGYRAYWSADGGQLDYNNVSALFGFLGDESFQMDPSKMEFSDLELYKVSVVEHDRIVAGVNYTHEFSKNFSVKAGAKYRDKVRSARFSDIFYGWIGTEDTPSLESTGQVVELPGGASYLKEMQGNIQSIYNGVLSTDGMQNFWNNNQLNLGVLEDDSEALEYNSGLGRNFDVNEQHLALYGMGTYDFSKKLTLLAGLRATQTITTVKGYAVTDDFLAETTNTKEYWSVLPMVHLKYEPKEDLILRLSATRTFARPNFGDITPGGTFITADNEFKGGNPNLNPTYSWNFDLLGEYYFKNIGLINAGVFYKSITDAVFNDTYQGAYNGIEGVEFSTPNNGNEAWIGGIEVGVNKRFDFLPGFFKHFGTQLNATFMNSEMTKPSGRVVKVPYQAKQLFNAQLYYENKGLNIRLAFNHKDKYAIAFGEADINDIYYGKYNAMDLSASYTFKKKFTIYTEVNNLLNAPLVYHYGADPVRPKQVEYYGIRGIAGFKYSF